MAETFDRTKYFDSVRRDSAVDQLRPNLPVFDHRNGWPGNAIVLGDFPLQPRILANGKHLPGLQLVGTVVTFVSRLFFPRCPTAIAGLVVAVVVGSLKRLSCYGFSHIRQEIGKSIGTAPAVANANASHAVIAFVVGRGSTADMHGFPGPIGFRLLTAARHAMRRMMLPLTAAIRGSTVTQIGADDFPFSTAIASAQPCALWSMLIAFGEDRPSAKMFPEKVNGG